MHANILILSLLAFSASPELEEELEAARRARRERPVGEAVEADSLELPVRDEPVPSERVHGFVGVLGGLGFDGDVVPSVAIRGGVDGGPWAIGLEFGGRVFGPHTEAIAVDEQTLGTAESWPVWLGAFFEACANLPLAPCGELGAHAELVAFSAVGDRLFRAQAQTRVGLRLDGRVRGRWRTDLGLEPWVALALRWRAIHATAAVEGVDGELGPSALEAGLELGVDYDLSALSEKR